VRHQPRARRYPLRWLWVALVLAVICAPILAVRTRALSPDGPGWLLYAVHDYAFVPLKGFAWVTLFPFVLIWLVPLALAALLIGLEFLTGAGPMRAFHRRMVFKIAAWPRVHWLLGPALTAQKINPGYWEQSILEDGSAATLRRARGFARRAVKAEQVSRWRAVAAAMGDGAHPDKAQLERLFDMLGLRLRLDASDAQAHLAALEAIAAFPDFAAAKQLRREVDSFLSSSDENGSAAPVLAALKALESINQFSAPQAAAHIRGAADRLTAPDLSGSSAAFALATACDAVVVFATAQACSVTEIAAFQQAWVDARLKAARPLQAAEGLIYFEMWSKRAERPTQLPPKSDLLTEVLGPAGTRAIAVVRAPEGFAWQGSGS
jgi:hypothetical protein